VTALHLGNGRQEDLPQLFGIATALSSGNWQC
jgi:hypothetical protein